MSFVFSPDMAALPARHLSNDRFVLCPEHTLPLYVWFTAFWLYRRRQTSPHTQRKATNAFLLGTHAVKGNQAMYSTSLLQFRMLIIVKANIALSSAGRMKYLSFGKLLYCQCFHYSKSKIKKESVRLGAFKTEAPRWKLKQPKPQAIAI